MIVFSSCLPQNSLKIYLSSKGMQICGTLHFTCILKFDNKPMHYKIMKITSYKCVKQYLYLYIFVKLF